MAETYYDVLGLSRKPTKDDLTIGYMQLACQWHPDNHDGNSDAAEKFRLIGEAFCVLFDPKLRFGYDKALKADPENEDARRLAVPLERTLALFEEMATKYVESELVSGSSESESVVALTGAGCPLSVAQRVAAKIYADERAAIRRSGYGMLVFGGGLFSLGAGIFILSVYESGGRSYVIWYWPLAVGLAMVLYALYCISVGRRALSVRGLFSGQH